jgi:ArsR family transcriptional regulator
MGTTKTSNFSDLDLRAAQLAKALGHPARIAILNLLVSKQACICGDIVDELPLSQSTVSQHLKELREVGIIKGEISGAKTCYCIDEITWHEMEAVFSRLFKLYIPSATCC